MTNPSSEPRFLAQTDDRAACADPVAWFRDQLTDATKKGCGFFRYSTMPNDPVSQSRDEPPTKPTALLIEGWMAQPAHQGLPRWHWQGGIQ